MHSDTFRQRFGLSSHTPIDKAFPGDARTGLAYVLADMHSRRAFADPSGSNLITELLRTGRMVGEHLSFDDDTPFAEQVRCLLDKLEWWQIYTFCERVYSHCIGDDDDISSEGMERASGDKRYFAGEVNNLLSEENLAYEFADGQFLRRGRAHTQVSLLRAGSVLGQSRLAEVRTHYNKARSFFQVPEPDVENCVKEALCALEACLNILRPKVDWKDFVRGVERIQGNTDGKIPPPLAQAIVKLYGYRGSGQGVAHAALGGNRVTALEAEAVLSLVASFITYLVDLYPEEKEEIPF